MIILRSKLFNDSNLVDFRYGTNKTPDIKSVNKEARKTAKSARTIFNFNPKNTNIRDKDGVITNLNNIALNADNICERYNTLRKNGYKFNDVDLAREKEIRSAARLINSHPDRKTNRKYNNPNINPNQISIFPNNDKPKEYKNFRKASRIAPYNNN